jgi:DNA uptake protein ComE-like DNA-binding protein
MRLTKLAITTLFGAALALPALSLPAMAQTPAAPAAPAPAKPAMTMPMTHPTMPATPAVTAATAPINLNTATPEQLDSLPGIGKARLKKIIAARPFTSVDQLDTKKVIPHSVYMKIKDKVTV